MAYCTRENLEQRFGETAIRNLVDTDNSGVINSDEAGRITSAIASAGVRIDAKISGIYSVPFSAVPDMIREIAIHIAFYFLCLRTGKRLAEAGSILDAADRDIEQIRKGTMVLTDGGREAAIEQTSAPEPTFTRTKRDTSGNVLNPEERGSMDTW